MRKVISFCIWGDNKLYNYGIYENALLLNKIFPDWNMVVYYTKTALLKVIDELKKINNVECILVDLPNNPRNSMLRFLAGFTTIFKKSIVFSNKNIAFYFMFIIR